MKPGKGTENGKKVAGNNGRNEKQWIRGYTPSNSKRGKARRLLGWRADRIWWRNRLTNDRRNKKKLGDLGGFGGGRGGGEENHISNSGGGGGHGTEHPPWRLAGIMGPARWGPPLWHGSYRLLSWLGKGGGVGGSELAIWDVSGFFKLFIKKKVFFILPISLKNQA